MSADNMLSEVLRWPDGQAPRVLVTDCWLANAGDAAIAVATQQLIERIAPGAAVLHAAYGTAEMGQRYPDLRFVPPLEHLLGTRWMPSAPERAEVARAFVADADLVLSQGGGFFHEGYVPWARLDALLRAGEIARSVAMVGQTVGQLSRAFARRDVRRLLTQLDAVVVRDAPSKAALVELGGAPEAIGLGTDLAVALLNDTPQNSTTDGSIGLVLSDHSPDVSAMPARRAAAVRLLAEVVRRHPDVPVRLWSSSQGVPGQAMDDEVAAAAVAELDSGQRRNVELVRGHLSAHDLLPAVSRCQYLVSMRFHPALFGAATGVPTVLLMDDPKVEVFAGTAFRRCVVRGTTAADIDRALELVTSSQAAMEPGQLAAELADRRAVVTNVLAALLG
jgi:polysaccharide pyruvyl transferase WcaK-like protein